MPELDPAKNKTYLGDGCYVSFDGFGLWLETSDGITTTNRIYLEPKVYAALVKYVDKLRDESGAGAP